VTSKWGKTSLTFLIAFIGGCGYGFPQNISENSNCPPNAPTEILAPEYLEQSDRLSDSEPAHAGRRLKRVATMTRNASVEVDNFLRRVRGSGTYYIFDGHPIVITAAHVVDGDSALIKVKTPTGEEVLSQVIFFNIRGRHDIAILLLESPLDSRIPMDLEIRDIVSCCAEDLIGESTVYTGDPGRHDQLTIFGSVSGYTDGGSIILHSYAWGGASGSNIFDNRGRLIGVIKATDINSHRISPFPQITEDIVWAAPASGLNVEQLSIILEIHRLLLNLE